MVSCIEIFSGKIVEEFEKATNMKETCAVIRQIDDFIQRLIEVAGPIDKYIELDKGCNYTQHIAYTKLNELL